MKHLFVAFSHSLTPAQAEGWDSITTLGSVAPDLQAQMSNIPATATLEEIQELAQAIVAQAVKVGATHFFMTGEPTLTMWANLYAHKFEFRAQISGNTYELFLRGRQERLTNLQINILYLEQIAQIEQELATAMVCVQSTTERRSEEVVNPDGTVTKTQLFQHVCWREMF